jgi:1,4-alpha-glucan branching enzyme
MKNHIFKTHAPQAKQVFLVGTFNAWDPAALPMERSQRGDWSAAVDLAPGRHEFKFVIDGEWCCEPGCDGPHEGCPGCVPNEMGTMNRFIEIR